MSSGFGFEPRQHAITYVLLSLLSGAVSKSSLGMVGSLNLSDVTWVYFGCDVKFTVTC